MKRIVALLQSCQHHTLTLQLGYFFGLFLWALFWEEEGTGWNITFSFENLFLYLVVKVDFVIELYEGNMSQCQINMYYFHIVSHFPGNHYLQNRDNRNMLRNVLIYPSHNHI